MKKEDVMKWLYGILWGLHLRGGRHSTCLRQIVFVQKGIVLGLDMEGNEPWRLLHGHFSVYEMLRTSIAFVAHFVKLHF